MTDIFSLDLTELTQTVKSAGFQPYRAKQLFYGLHTRNGIVNISSLPKELIDYIKQSERAAP